MKKLRCIALILSVSMLMPMLCSCAKKSKNTTVRKDDPWFESTRFDLKTDIKESEMLEGSTVSYGNGKVYHIYSIINLADYENYRRTMLDTYDDKGNLLSQVKVQDPANYTIDGIKKINPPDSDNKAEAIATLFAPGGFQAAVIKIDLESGKTDSPRFFKDEKGNSLSVSLGGSDSAGITDVYLAGEYYIPVIITSGLKGGAAVHAWAFKGADFVCGFDFSELPNVYDVEEFSYDSKSNSFYTVGYTTNEGLQVLKFDAKTGKKISSEKYTAQGDVNLADYKSVPSGDLCKIDTLGNITMFDPQSQEVKSIVDNNWYTPYFADLTQDTSLVTCDSDTVVIHSKRTIEYSFVFSGFDETITILKKCGTNPHEGKKIIELATPIDKGMTDYLSNAIYEFNRTDNEYLIRVWSKYKSGIKTGRDLSMLNVDNEKLYTMIMELKGDDAPDLAIGIQKNYAMRDDIFEDLTGYLDQSVLDKQFANVFEASKIGGKQYFLPITLEIEGLVIDKTLIKDGAVGITFEDYDKMVKNGLDGFTPYDYPGSIYNYRYGFLLSCIDTKAAIEGGRADFGTDQFKAAAEYSKEHFAGDTAPKEGDYVWDDEVKKPRTGCRYDRIESFVEFIHACKSSEGCYTIIGTPSVDARGPRFRAVETISVTSLSDMKDGCRKFINFLFSGAGYGDSSKEFQNIITNREIMARNMSMITEKNNIGQKMMEEMNNYMSGMTDYSNFYGYKTATKDMENNMMESLYTVSTYYYDDPVLTSFVAEDVAPYYAGDRSIDDVIKIINDRADKYIKEM